MSVIGLHLKWSTCILFREVKVYVEMLRWLKGLFFQFFGKTIDNEEKNPSIKSVFMYYMIQNDLAFLKFLERKAYKEKEKQDLHLYRWRCIANVRFWQFLHKHLKMRNYKGNPERSLTIALLLGVSMMISVLISPFEKATPSTMITCFSICFQTKYFLVKDIKTILLFVYI